MDHNVATYENNMATGDTVKLPSIIDFKTYHRTFTSQGPYVYAKRVLDVFFSVLFLVLLSPLLFMISLFIKTSSPGKAVFKQTRIGQHGRPFTIYKFRTMATDAPPDMPTAKFKDSEAYITKAGRFLRRTSLDELLQLVNVLKGNMSFVGPRPLVESEKEIHSLRLSRGIYNLKPGITGLAQINGRDFLNPSEKVSFDEEYFHSFSFRTDFVIAFKTVQIVLSRKGIMDGCKPENTGEMTDAGSPK